MITRLSPTQLLLARNISQKTYVSEHEATSIPDTFNNSQLFNQVFISGESAMPPAIKRMPDIETVPQAQIPSDRKESVTTKRNSVAKKREVANKTCGERSWNERSML
jgi:hypothetical protein